ncbi:hypothetical protein ES703_60590 [subsurface metagenome]
MTMRTHKGRTKKLRPIEFEATPDERKAVAALKAFYGLKTHASLLRLMLAFSIIDVAAEKANGDWTEEQREAFQLCSRMTTSFSEAVILQVTKGVLSKQPADKKMTLAELSQLSKKKLIEIAEAKSIATTGLRKSGLAKRIHQVGKE